jgi:hypothetical protein
MLSDEKIDVRFVELDVEREKSSADFQTLCPPLGNRDVSQ